MAERTGGRLEPRALAALVMLFAGLLLVVTGGWLATVRGACGMRAVHLSAALLFVGACCWHGMLNRQALLRHWRDRAGSAWRDEARVALALALLSALLGLLWMPGRGR